ncbi:hypothetical protein C8Q79DRAFT_1009634 [Trametes meyenii]|nr:hypothetical protein C8Q79DRAFT_1009634 [Trametes meyenii]
MDRVSYTIQPEEFWNRDDSSDEANQAKILSSEVIHPAKMPEGLTKSLDTAEDCCSIQSITPVSNEPKEPPVAHATTLVRSPHPCMEQATFSIPPENSEAQLLASAPEVIDEISTAKVAHPSGAPDPEDELGPRSTSLTSTGDNSWRSISSASVAPSVTEILRLRPFLHFIPNIIPIATMNGASSSRAGVAPLRPRAPQDASLIAQMTDGKEIRRTEHPVSIETIFELGLRCANRIKSLRVFSLRAGTDASLVQANIVQRYMPHIEAFGVQIVPRSATTNGLEGPATFDLSHDCFPSLKSLYLDGAIVTLSLPVLSRLRSLSIHLEHGLPQNQLLQLPQFLHCANSLAQLEVLELGNCFKEVVLQGPPSPPRAPQPVMHLKKLKLEAYPSIISKILSAFIVPVTCNVVLRAHDRRDASPEYSLDAFRRMLPRERHCLPVLQDVVSLAITMTVGATQCFRLIYSGKTRAGATVSLWLLSHIRAENVHQIDPYFERLVSSELPANIFRCDLVERLTVYGNLGALNAASWGYCLVQLPGLKKLMVTDGGLRGTIQDVLHVLSTHALTRCDRAPMCPLLKSIDLAGGAQADTLEAARHCLRWRHDQGGLHLDKFVLDMYCDQPFPPRSVEYFHHGCEPFVRDGMCKMASYPQLERHRRWVGEGRLEERMCLL